MLTFDSIPQARVVRHGGQHFTPPPRAAEPSQLGEQLRTVAAYAIGLWPLTGIVLLAIGLLWMAGMTGAP
ncbi:MAG: hypothetical protein JWO36_468 [Myxococcales bacterium]|nr:hypothetical protein [Myxococcales bacterium]